MGRFFRARPFGIIKQTIAALRGSVDHPQEWPGRDVSTDTDFNSNNRGNRLAHLRGSDRPSAPGRGEFFVSPKRQAFISCRRNNALLGTHVLPGAPASVDLACRNCLQVLDTWIRYKVNVSPPSNITIRSKRRTFRKTAARYKSPK